MELIKKFFSHFPILLQILFLGVYLSPGFSYAQNSVSANEKSKELVLTKHFLNLPVQNNVQMQKMSLVVEGESVRDFDIELAVNKPDFWVFIDISTFKGKNAVLTVKQAPSNSEGFDMIYQSDTIKDEETLYREKLRPQFHFSSRRGWNNDPNGLVYYNGEYHLFYQHNPYGWKWGNMHWGHAVSGDLINWKELPDALYPDRLGTMFSGSAVIDQNNSSGFQTGNEKVMVAVYTANSPETQVQCIAYSNDKGRTWTKYDGNPVIGDRRKIVGSTNDRDPKVRDPKVFRHNPTNKW